MIVVTGAAGKTGRALIGVLAEKGLPVRAFVRRDNQVQMAKELGAHEVVVGDMRVEDDFSRAMHGAQSVYHICPNVSPDELAIGRTAIAAAASAGVELFAYHSVLHPQTEAMPHHWQKLRVEEALFESNVPFVILQPAAYMQNVMAGWNNIASRGIHTIPYRAETRLSMVDLVDVAEAAATVLSEGTHFGATYELAGPDPLSQNEVAATLARKLGRPVRVHQISLTSWTSEARFKGIGDYQVNALAQMFTYYDRHGLVGNPTALSWLLGRKPTSFAEFVERYLAESGAEHLRYD